MPAQLQVLACVKPASDGGESTFLDLWAIISKIEKEDPALFRGLFVPRTVVFGRSVWFGGTLSWRHENLICVHPAIRPSPEDDVGTKFRQWVRRATPVRIPLKAGDVVVASNHRLVHGRTGFTDTSRLIVRELFWLREPMPAPEPWIAQARAIRDRLAEQLEGEPGWIKERFGFLGAAGIDSPLITPIVMPTQDRKSPERQAELEGTLRRLKFS